MKTQTAIRPFPSGDTNMRGESKSRQKNGARCIMQVLPGSLTCVVNS